MFDITGSFVEVIWDTKGCLWVNIDGQCKLRAYHSKEIHVQNDLVYPEIEEKQDG